ncbi:MAG TPA: hypothetical protein VNX21_02205 [Candidatus Thermoplasmatota archaeon]|nr:hypothetical protein [Candidatus Thermoplasmatota archaeon]
MPLSNFTLTYRSPAVADGGQWIENFEDKYGRLARAGGPFNYLILRNKSAAELEVELNQDPAHVIVVPAGDSFADAVQFFSSLRVKVAGAAVAEDEVIVVPKRVTGPAGVDVGS